MFASRAYFSLSQLTDPSRHREFNAWHQLDHRPENLLLPGVAWGDRWVRSPDCAEASVADEAHAGAQYSIMYWFREPLEQTLADFRALAEQAFQAGRRPDLEYKQLLLRSFFVPIKGYAAPRVLVGPEVIPFRPVRGVHLTLSRILRHDHTTDALFAWYDRVRIPDLLTCPSVAGAWTFASEDLFKPERDLAAPALRIQLLYLDGDPLDFVAELEEREPQWRAAGRGHANDGNEEILFSSPLRSITPWQWDWFDTATA